MKTAIIIAVTKFYMWRISQVHTWKKKGLVPKIAPCWMALVGQNQIPQKKLGQVRLNTFRGYLERLPGFGGSPQRADQECVWSRGLRTTSPQTEQKGRHRQGRNKTQVLTHTGSRKTGWKMGLP